MGPLAGLKVTDSLLKVYFFIQSKQNQDKTSGDETPLMSEKTNNLSSNFVVLHFL